jgi:hypothetical protein
LPAILEKALAGLKLDCTHAAREVFRERWILLDARTNIERRLAKQFEDHRSISVDRGRAGGRVTSSRARNNT